MGRNKLNVISMLSKEMVDCIDITNELVEDAFNTDLTFEEMRNNYKKERVYWNKGGPVMEKILEEYINIYGSDIRIRLYYPSKEEKSPAILFIHGGGFVVGNIDTHDKIMRMLAYKSNSIVVGIDYSLSPEATYPKAIEECSYLLEYLNRKGGEYNIDINSISVAGDSGGANLALGSVLFLRDKGKDINYIKSILLYYGTFGLTDSSSIRLYGGYWDGLTKKDLDNYAKLYLGQNDINESIYYNLLNADLTKYVPPTFILYSDVDPLRDDSITLYEMLKSRNHETKLVAYKGVIHGFLHNSKILPEAITAIEEGVEFFKKYI